jgi:hypothetical protein
MEKGSPRPRSRLIWLRPRRTKRSWKLSKSKQPPLARPILSSRKSELEAQACTAAARAEALCIQLATSTPLTKGSPSHALKKSKGIEGPTAVTSPSSLTSHLSPQQKSAVVKKRVMIDSPLHSEGHFSSSGSGIISGSSDDSETALGSSGAPPLCQPLAAGQFGWVSPRGG